MFSNALRQDGSCLQVNGRSLQQHGGTVTKRGLVQSPMASWLQALCRRVGSMTGMWSDSPNHVLINRYQPGEGIFPHLDGPSYLPAVCILSLGSPAIFRFHKLEQEGALSAELVIGMLVVAPADTVHTGLQHMAWSDHTLPAELSALGVAWHPALQAPWLATIVCGRVSSQSSSVLQWRTLCLSGCSRVQRRQNAACVACGTQSAPEAA